jgi:hypothetical protein
MTQNRHPKDIDMAYPKCPNPADKTWVGNEYAIEYHRTERNAQKMHVQAHPYFEFWADHTHRPDQAQVMKDALTRDGRRLGRAPELDRDGLFAVIWPN